MSPLPDPVIRIHSITGARSACRVMGDRAFGLLSPEHAGQTHGAQWFADLVMLVREDFPACNITAILDCRGRVSGALAAIELGLDAVMVDPMPEPQLENLRDMAAQTNRLVMTEFPDKDVIYQMADDLLPDHELDKRLLAHLAP
ncbi:MULTISPECIES: hypothetical protein [unclassified Thalassospira]|uniref:hypothetical protein n=1 Tax=unclassified Thalassospira TaxID=2648997 RepID=UPI0007A59935|nr:MULTISPECIES: hypothetical protein [unclassified Thalassospira]ONH88313.1 hypothetical protein TH47_07430 [Thalassospira sp. MCCC 1A02803]